MPRTGRYSGAKEPRDVGETHGSWTLTIYMSEWLNLKGEQRFVALQPVAPLGSLLRKLPYKSGYSFVGIRASGDRYMHWLSAAVPMYLKILLL